MDIYLLDQILKGRFSSEIHILDAGCGEGRNTHYFVKNRYSIVGIDKDPAAIQMARVYARSLDPSFDPERFQVCGVENIFYQDEVFDLVISSAVLHFAEDKNHFLQMVSEMVRVLKPGGLLWIRTCTDADGNFGTFVPLRGGRATLPDGSERFLLTKAMLASLLERFPIAWMEPPKSVLVHGKRAMGVFLFIKH
ncbi:class I SAM-dependent methyltransferase [Pleomorphovibrio marinus]|uniref:class I SAM-dependent methyltransferase n=1 Tax=Pleomorphovibrio marinus TaxID=2164132 RepID=UPI002936F251|nr:class I SAM-dependent methyltransferase [Pleomorphovibrio marinus]